MLMSHILLLLITAVISSSNAMQISLEDLSPTNEEISRALVVEPPLSWIRAIKSQKSIRLLALGGSNTWNPNNYLPKFERGLKVLQNDSLVINGALSGTAITLQSFDFELGPLDLWPNVILVECAINCNHDITTISQVERTLQFYMQKWSDQHLPLPRVLFLNLFSVGQYYNHQSVEGHFYPPLEKDVEGNCTHQLLPFNVTRLESLTLDQRKFNPNGLYFNRGSPQDMYLTALARFNRYPVLSASDVLWPSFVRYFTTHDECSHWPMIADGVHLSDKGSTFIVDSILLPFVKKYMLSTNSHGLDDHYHDNKRQSDYSENTLTMFPKNNENNHIVMNARSWGSQYNSLPEFVLSSPGFAMSHTIGHDDNGHLCYGSSKPPQDAYFQFRVFVHQFYFKHMSEEAINKKKFKVIVDYIHSWNSDYVGDVRCTLFKCTGWEAAHYEACSNTTANTIPPVVKDFVIQGSVYNNAKMKHTGPMPTTITTELGYGAHVLKCDKLDDHFACLGAITVLD